MLFSAVTRIACAFFLSGALLSNLAPAQQPQRDAKFPCPEKLAYKVEWRMVNAGTALVQQAPIDRHGWELNLHVESAGLVSRLYRVLDTYKVQAGEGFCGSSAVLDAQEGKKHTVTRLRFDAAHKRTEYEEHDLIKGTTKRKELDVSPCTYEIVGALAALRLNPPEVGKAITLPVTNGKKLASAKIQAQDKEKVNAGGQNYSTVRYEAFLFDNVLYRRKGRLFIWLTDDPAHLPVQLQLHLGFPIGNITLQLDKHEQM